MSVILFTDTTPDPSSLNGKNHLDVSLAEKLRVTVQFDPLTTDPDGSVGTRLYFRMDETEAAGGQTVALLKPQGYLESGCCQTFTIDPDATEKPTLHLLLTDKTGSPISAGGGANDAVYYLAERVNPD
jgi:hypothetical protein